MHPAIAKLRSTPDYHMLTPEDQENSDVAAVILAEARSLGINPIDLLERIIADYRRRQFTVIIGGAA
jgi:uncharacterized protein (DUF111 family)